MTSPRGAPVGMIIPNTDIGGCAPAAAQGQQGTDQARTGVLYLLQEVWPILLTGPADTDGHPDGKRWQRVAGGAVAKLILDAMGIDVIAYTTEIRRDKAACHI